MKFLRLGTIAALVGTIAAFAAWVWIGHGMYNLHKWVTTPKPPAYAYRFRMTLEVEVDGEVKSASTVIDEVVYDKTADLSPAGVIAYMTADAIFLDLGQGRNVVATLWFPKPVRSVSHPGAMVRETFGVKPPEMRSIRGTRDVPHVYLPQLLSFGDPADVMSVKLLQPTEESFFRHFGSGVKFKRLWVEMVEPGRWPEDREAGEPMVSTIASELPWVDTLSVAQQNELKTKISTIDASLSISTLWRAFRMRGSR